MAEKGILVVSFGTSYADTREKTIGALEQALHKAFPERVLYRAFTSKFIIRKLKKEGVVIDTVKEALEKMYDDGIRELLVQPTHMINGIENNRMLEEIKEEAEKFEKINIGNPLLQDPEDYKALAKIVKEEYPIGEKEALVLMGHGSSHYANAAYPAFEYALRDLEYDHIFVGTVEGYPSFEEVKKQLKRTNIKKACLVPFMIVAGDHARNDMTGGENSWYEILKRDGLEIRYEIRGLGEMKGVQELYIAHAKKAVEGEVECH